MMRAAKRISPARKPVLKTSLLLAMLLMAIVITPATTLTQSKAPADVATAGHVSDTSALGDKKDSAAEAEIIGLKKQLADQQKQINELRLLIEEQRKPMAGKSEIARDSSAPSPVESQPDSVAINTKEVTTAVRKNAGSANQSSGGQETQPLSLRIGSATIVPVGFMDFSTIFRSTNGGSGLGTNFGSIPFNNTPAGRLSETRLTAQNSRIGLRVDATVKDASVLGYFESDFLGSTPGNLVVSSNSDSNRLRVYFADVRKGKLELLGGQSWSLLTPNRRGLSPVPSDIFYTQDIDSNYQVGLVWSRSPQFRVVYHPNESVAIGLSLENPEQYIGGSAGGGLVTLPSALVTPYANELNNGNTALAVPNLHPDIITKVAFDRQVANRSLHFEVAGLIRSFKLFNPLNQRTFTTTGGGGSVNVNFEIVKNLRVVSNNFFSNGGGRWIFGQAPDLIVQGDGSPSLIHSGSTVTGLESQATKDTLLYGYYGGVYIKRNVAIDPTNGKFVGYGFPGSPPGQNRTIQEATVGAIRTFWRDPKYGALQLMGQYSYLTRRPWSVAVGQPKEAHTNMIFLNLRYILPGSAPTVK